MKIYKIIQGDNLAAMREMADNSVDSIVTDPPYGLAFMGKKWDYDVPSVETWRECLRVLKPGGHLLAFGGSRTYHRLVIPIEDAGFEIRDQIMWLYGSGFPKSHNVSKAIDKAAGAKREVIGPPTRNSGQSYQWGGEIRHRTHAEEKASQTAPATDDAKRWDGWGTALKPAHEPIVLARKPFAGTVAANVLEHGTGALNIDGCRVPADGVNLGRLNNARDTGTSYVVQKNTALINNSGDKGRFPANLIHDGSDAVVGIFPNTKTGSVGVRNTPKVHGGVYGGGWGAGNVNPTIGDEGSAARYFYCAKASKRDRDEGLEARNSHPTVKPTELMRYLVRLVTPPNGTVLDPFCGSGSTGKAAVLEGFRFIGLELDPAYVEIAEARCEWAASNPDIPKAPAEDPPTPAVQSEPAEPDRCQLKLFVK